MTLEARTESGALPVIHRREQRVLVRGSRFMSRRAKKTPKGLTANGGDKQFSNRPVTLGYGQLQIQEVRSLESCSLPTRPAFYQFDRFLGRCRFRHVVALTVLASQFA